MNPIQLTTLAGIVGMGIAAFSMAKLYFDSQKENKKLKDENKQLKKDCQIGGNS